MIASDNKHKVAVLMATHNGATWLSEQIDSILNQHDVEVEIYVSDDNSDELTRQLLTSSANNDTRIKLLPFGEVFGSAGKNFYNLIEKVDVAAYTHIAFADQDDIWQPDKLARHIRLLESYHAEAISSDVIAFWPNGHTKKIIKSQPQRLFDFLFESAGPGCTFLMTPWLVQEIKRVLSNNVDAKKATLHDWLAYNICRSLKRKWIIDSVPSVLYRQHAKNVVGANTGLRAKLSRLKQLRSGWYRAEVINMCKISVEISYDPDIDNLLKLLTSNKLSDRLKLIFQVNNARRRMQDRVLLSIGIFFYLF